MTKQAFLEHFMTNEINKYTTFIHLSKVLARLKSIAVIRRFVHNTTLCQMRNHSTLILEAILFRVCSLPSSNFVVAELLL